MSGNLLILASARGADLAHGIFEAASRHHDIDQAYLLLPSPGSGPFPRERAPNEFFWDARASPGLYPAQGANAESVHSLARLLEAIRPDVAYVQIDSQFNYSLLEKMRAWNPQLRIFGALDDYYPICAKSDVMFVNDRPCDRAAPIKCQACMRDIKPHVFWERSRRFRHYLEMLDGIITSTNYMQNRYLDWGIKPEKLYTAPPIPPSPLPGYRRAHEREYGKFAYFGRAMPESGLQKALCELIHLQPEIQKKIEITIYGAELSQAPKKLQAEINSYLGRSANPAGIIWREAPKENELAGAVANADWIVAPELWGAAISAAMRMARRLAIPIIASGHAGYGELITHDVDGLLVGGESPLSTWGRAFSLAARNRDLWSRLHMACPSDNPNASIDALLRIMGIMEDAWDF